MTQRIQDQVRAIVLQHGRLGAKANAAVVTDTADLYSLGLTSHASVAVMLALESAFDVEFPERMLRRQVFESVRNIAQALAELTGQTSQHAEAI